MEARAWQAKYAKTAEIEVHDTAIMKQLWGVVAEIGGTLLCETSVVVTKDWVLMFADRPGLAERSKPVVVGDGSGVRCLFVSTQRHPVITTDDRADRPQSEC